MYFNKQADISVSNMAKQQMSHGYKRPGFAKVLTTRVRLRIFRLRRSMAYHTGAGRAFSSLSGRCSAVKVLQNCVLP